MIRNLVNGKVYVGQTRNFAIRRAGHLYAARKGLKRPLYAAIRKYGEVNFLFEILEECQDDDVNERERFWVKQLDSFNSLHGYNLTSGGEQGKDMSDLTRQRLSESLSGLEKSLDHRKKISNARLGWVGLRGDANPNRKRVLEGRPLKESTRQVLSRLASQRTGEKNSNAKLTEGIVRCIKQRLAAGATVADVVREFDISRSQVNRIKSGQHWTHVRVEA